VNTESKKSKQAAKSPVENTCSHCLYFEAARPGRRPLKGNCSYHKEWIDYASFYTCSEMSSLSLKPKGIYRLESNGMGGWVYVRREGKVRSRLFLVKGAGDGGGQEGAGAKTAIVQEAFNVLNGYLWVPTPDEVIEMSASIASGLGLFIPEAPATRTNWHGGMSFEEH